MTKEMYEKRNNLVNEMEKITSTAKTETRAFNADETKRFDEIKAEIDSIDATDKKIEETRAYTKTEIETKKEDDKMETRALEDIQNFDKYLRGETRALDVSNNGAIIPTTVANKIIEKVKELSPIYAMSTIFNVGGDLVFPVYDETSSNIGAAYVDDLTELTEGTGKFTSVTLQNFIAGCLAKVSKSLINRSGFDLVTFVINKVSTAIAEFLEKELLVGTTGKMTGVLSSTYGITSASATAITSDELIDLQMTVPTVYQAKASWIMNKATFKAIRKLKDGNNQYILNKDATMEFGWELLGKSVYVSDNMPVMAGGAKAIAYGDFSGLYVKLAQGVDIQVLVEKYATQHAVGVVGYIEVDSKIVEPQKLAVLTMKAA